MLHPAQRRYWAEEVVRLRTSDALLRAAAPYRASHVDPNPHQVEAVLFALKRLREGGAILADEVGLGKTIEAGLVIAQLQAEGARRVLLVTPKSLVGQWRQELLQLFGLLTKDPPYEGDGIFIVHREAAGSERGAASIQGSAPFDLCVIDEAHEVFAGIYRRYNQAGEIRADSDFARLAGRLREALASTPVLLLTATPIQNNLAELWSLVQYVDPTGTLLGDLPTFRELFCADDDRRLKPGAEDELRSRLASVLQRTLRRQAQPFLERPFVHREARLFEYHMSQPEKSLYDDVTAYLLSPATLAFQGRYRQLLLLNFHRRMASSVRALEASLQKLEQRLAKRLSGNAADEPDDVDDEVEAIEVELAGELEHTAHRSTDGAALAAELEKVRSFIARANALGDTEAKFAALETAVRFVAARAKSGQGSDRLVIFTESLATQAWLRDRLVASGLVSNDDVTLLNGSNDGARAQQALSTWQREVRLEGLEPPTEIAVRLALVHEFRTRSRIFISTEAGAKGLNLQFCNTVVNYDLPWNPQRIEQRIGRCHRYGQQHDVTVVNFLAADNEAQRLTFEILSQKLELFGSVLDASDQVLHRAKQLPSDIVVTGLGAEFESELRRIYERARTAAEVEAELRALRERMSDERRRFEEVSARTERLLSDSFDESVQRVFRRHKTDLPLELTHLEQLLAKVLDASGDSLAQTLATLRAQGQFAAAAIEAPPDVPKGRGRLRVAKVSLEGFEKTGVLVPFVVFADGRRLGVEVTKTLFDAPWAKTQTEAVALSNDVLSDAQDEAVFESIERVEAQEQQRFEAATTQAERFLADRLLVTRKRLASANERVALATSRRESAVGIASREEAEASLKRAQHEVDELEALVERLEHGDDHRFLAAVSRARTRRYQPPRVECLFELDVVLQ